MGFPNAPTSRTSADPNGNARKLLLAATLVTILLTFVPYSEYLLYPLRLFVTFIHESGHALAAIITGGEVESLHIQPNGSGVTYTREAPAWAWFVLSGGYLGTTLFGALLLQVGRFSHRRNVGRMVLYGMAGYLALVLLLWSHNPFNNPQNSFTNIGGHGPDLFTLPAGMVLVGILFVLARFAPPRTADFLASFLAVQCSLNALCDLRDLLIITHNHLGDSDAQFMANIYGLPPTFWAGLWALMALAILGASLWSYLKATSRRPAQAPTQGVLPQM
jgi:hypothetical protein